ncbi:MAG: hypothetical protein ACLFST_04720 [Spirochaetia bacterium]
MKYTIITVFIIIVLALTGCAGTQSGNGLDSREVPDWVTSPPLSDSENEYFVVSASDRSGDIAAAEEEAALSMIAEINRALGVELSVETSAEARASLEDFEASVKQAVTQSGSGTIAGLRVADRYIYRTEERVTVYLLGQYDKAAFLKEQREREALVEEVKAAVSVPEQMGDQYLSEGRYFDAVAKYIEAAAAAAKENIRNADVKFERNINKAKEVLGKINLQKENDNLSTTIGDGFNEEFVLQVTAGNGGVETPLGGVNILVSYWRLRSNGSPGIQTVNISSDTGGMARFTHPVPDLVGDRNVTMSLDLSSAMEPLEDVPRSFRSHTDALFDAAAEKRVKFEYTVISRAKNIPTGVLVLDIDNNGNPTGNSSTAQGIRQALSEQGFRISTINTDPEILQGKSESEIIQVLKDFHGDDVERVIFGRISISEFDSSDDGYIVKVSGTITAADLISGQILFSDTAFKRSRSSSSSGAVRSAFISLGSHFGDELARRLP